MPTLRLRPDIEDSLRLINGVRAASVVTGPDAALQEIHVLASNGKPAKQVVRDIQSLTMAKFDIDIDHRIVSVVQLDDVDLGLEPAAAEITDGASPAGEPAAPRPVIASIGQRISNDGAEVTVTLTMGGMSFDGKASGSPTPSQRHTLVARATLDAISELLGTPAEVEHATVVELAGRRVAVCMIQLPTPRIGELVVTGSAIVRGDEADALARSVLSALNRRLTG